MVTEVDFIPTKENVSTSPTEALIVYFPSKSVSVPRVVFCTTTLTPDFDAYDYAAGEWRVRITDENGCSAISESVLIEVNEIPVAVATNNGPICQGDEVQLFANIPNATYEWYELGSTTPISTQQNPIITVSGDNFEYELYITVEGCRSEAAITTIDKIPAPESAPTASYVPNVDCSTGNIELTANVITSGDFTYEWTGPNGFISSVANPVIAGANPDYNGIYELTINAINGGCSATYATNVIDNIPNTIDEPFITGDNIACVNGTIVLNATQYNAVNVEYTWMLNGLIISGEESDQLTITE